MQFSVQEEFKNFRISLQISKCILFSMFLKNAPIFNVSLFFGVFFLYINHVLYSKQLED